MELNKLIKRINSSHSAFRVICGLSCEQFIKINDLRSLFNLNDSGPYYVLYKYRNPVYSTNINVTVDENKSSTIGIGKLHFIYSSIHFGYLFELPMYDIIVEQNFMALNEPKINTKKISKIDPVIKNNHISVYTSGKSIIALSNTSNIINIKI